MPRKALRARSHTYLQFIWQGNRRSTGLQGTSACAMASICVHRALPTPPDSAPGHIPVPGGTKLGSPGPFSGANCLIINNGRCQVNFTKARFDSIRPGRHSVLLILPENLGKSPQPRHLNQATSTTTPQLKLCKIWIAKWC